MDLAVNVAFRMVYKLMHKAIVKQIITNPAIGKDLRAVLHLAEYFG